MPYDESLSGPRKHDPADDWNHDVVAARIVLYIVMALCGVYLVFG